MSNMRKLMILAPLDDSTRGLILRLFKPQFANVYARHITYAYNLQPMPEIPDGERLCTIYGHHAGDRHEALVCTVDGATRRPDGRLLHITLSTGLHTDGTAVPPVRAGEIDPERIRAVDPVHFPVVWRLADKTPARPDTNRALA